VRKSHVAQNGSITVSPEADSDINRQTKGQIDGLYESILTIKDIIECNSAEFLPLDTKRMSFRDHAFVELVELLDGAPTEQIGASFRIHKRDIRELPKRFAPKAAPKLSSEKIATLSEKQTEDQYGAEIARKHADKFMMPPTVVPPRVLLPGLFATLGHAICDNRRSVEVLIRYKVNGAKRETLKASQFEPFENNIAEGTRQFGEWLIAVAENARSLEFFFSMNPVPQKLIH